MNHYFPDLDKKICIVGTGGFGRETLTIWADLIDRTGHKLKDVTVFMVDDSHYSAKEILGVPVVPKSAFDPSLYQVVVGVGDPGERKKIVEGLPQETSFTSLIHPTAVISRWVEIGEGAIITAGCILTCDIKIGKHFHFNLHATLGHDCVVGDFFTAAPAVNISGKCTFGDHVYLGTNASLKQGLSICSNVIVGMGAVVVKDITEPGTYIGNPLRKLA
jgi:sugar O-acyltransferase (sialic acid O-acetyltransferase NeuD family)